MEPQTAMLAMLYLARAAGQLGFIGEFQFTDGFQSRQILVRFCGFAICALSWAGLNEKRFLAVRRAIRGGLARDENGGVNCGVKRIALTENSEAVCLKHLAHPQFAGKGEKSVGNDETKVAARAEQLKTQIGEVNIKILQVSGAFCERVAPVFAFAGVRGN